MDITSIKAHKDFTVHSKIRQPVLEVKKIFGQVTGIFAQPMLNFRV
jgi:hypothetical protein